MRSDDRDRADAHFRGLAAVGTAVVPTLSLHRTLELLDDLPSRAEEWKYVPAWQTGSRPDQLVAPAGGRTPEQARQIRRIFEHRLPAGERVVWRGCAAGGGHRHRHGIPRPGLFALRHEPALLVAEGLTPAEALRAATRNAARTLGLPAVGTVARGQAADLLVLDAIVGDDGLL
ncbi:amidohydrolase family protein [Streptomyces canus]|uniref:amidohydrolase family protein n=1 Tax=Streptomyces canus TaxID=58343 RepID=UPI0033BFB498